VLGPRTYALYGVPPSAVFFWDKSPREAFERPRPTRGADVGDDAAVEGQPAGFTTLRSSSRSALAEQETMLTPRMVSCSVAQAMHL
jgi:hypothetical protein